MWLAFVFAYFETNKDFKRGIKTVKGENGLNFFKTNIRIKKTFNV